MRHRHRTEAAFTSSVERRTSDHLRSMSQEYTLW
jgi:hypothetical protein